VPDVVFGVGHSPTYEEGLGVQRFRFTPRHPVVRVAFTATGELVTAQPHTSVAVRHRHTGEATVTFPTQDAADFSHLLVHPHQPFVAVQTPKWCRVYDFTRPPDPSWFDSPERFAAVGVNDHGFRFFHARFPETLHAVSAGRFPSLGTHRVRIRTGGELVAVTPDARFALFVRTQVGPVLLDTGTGRVVANLGYGLKTRHVRLGHSVVEFAPDGAKLALGNGDSLAVFDLSRVSPGEHPEADEPTRKPKSLHPLFTLDRPDPLAGRGTHADRAAERWVPPVAFDPDGRTLLAVGLRNRVQRIDVATGGVIVEWGWRAEAVRSLAVAPDGLTAAAGCRLGELIVWDME
jgi:WD40 repeat protein